MPPRPPLRPLRLDDRVAPAAGLLDPSFGSNGTVTVGFPLESVFEFGGEAQAAAVQPDGRLILAGRVTEEGVSGGDFAVVRLTRDGQLDPTFGTGGRVRLPLDRGGATDDGATSVVVQPDGRIVLGGFAGLDRGEDYRSDVDNQTGFAAARLLPDGTPDPTFGTNGTVAVELPAAGGAVAYGVAVGPAGEVVLAGTANRDREFQTRTPTLAVVRLRADGTPDGAFADAGRLVLPLGVDSPLVAFEGGRAKGVVVRPDGRILVAGSDAEPVPADGSTRTDFVAVQLRPDGTPDPAFGGGDGVSYLPVGGFGRANAVALQPDGRAVLAGALFGGPTTIGVVRVLADGTVDTSFGGGLVNVRAGGGNSEGRAVAFQADGRVVVGGFSGDRDFTALRLTAAGLPDPTFGTDGLAFAKIDPRLDQIDQAAAVLVQPGTGRVVLAGFTSPDRGVGGFRAARFLADADPTPVPPPVPPPTAGDPDPRFGSNGRAFFDLPNVEVFAAAAQPDGRVVLVGDIDAGTAGGGDFVALRVLPDGRLDPTFGTGGKAVIPVNAGPDTLTGDRARAVAVLPDGRILIAGSADTGRVTATGAGDVVTRTSGMAVVRLLPDGRLDPAFGGGDGRVVIPAGPDGDAEATSLAVLADGRVVLGGSAVRRRETFRSDFRPFNAFVVEYTDVAAARLLADGSPDPAFGAGGAAVVTFNDNPASQSGAAAVAVTPDGRVVLAGFDSNPGPPGLTDSRDVAVVRLRADGTPDPTFGAGGKTTVRFRNESLSLANDAAATGVGVRPDGRVVVAASGRFFGPFLAAQLLPDGSPDPAFGTAGQVRVRFAPTGGSERSLVTAAVLEPGGTLVLAGSTTVRGVTGFTTDVAAARLLADGSPDPTFGDNGLSVVEFDAGVENRGSSGATAVAVLGNRDVVLAGFRGAGVAVARLLGTDRPVVVDPPVVDPPVVDPPVVDPPVVDPPVVDPPVIDPPLPAAPPGFAVGRGDAPTVAGFDPAGAAAYTLPALDGFAGGVRVATADVNGDGAPDLIVGAGPGGPARVRILFGPLGVATLLPLPTPVEFVAFEAAFTGGVFVTAADLDGDGRAEVVVTPDRGGGPVVAVFRADGSQVVRFFGIDDPGFRGGARAAAGDVNADGRADLLVAAGFGGGPRLAIFDGRGVLAGGTPPKLLPDFFVFEDTLRNGVFVAAGDLTSDGAAEVVVGGGPGGGPRVFALDGAALMQGRQAPVANFFAGDPTARGGVRVAARDGRLVTGSGENEPAAVRVYAAATARAGTAPDQTLSPFGGAALGDGVYVG